MRGLDILAKSEMIGQLDLERILVFLRPWLRKVHNAIYFRRVWFNTSWSNKLAKKCEHFSKKLTLKDVRKTRPMFMDRRGIDFNVTHVY